MSRYCTTSPVHKHTATESSDYDDLANGRRTYFCIWCGVNGTSASSEGAPIEWADLQPPTIGDTA